MANKQAN